MQTAELKTLMNTVAPQKIFGARLKEAFYEVSVHETCWTEPGAINVLSGRHCLIELAEAPAFGRSHHLVQPPNGLELTVGRLNFMPPESERKVRWTPGRRQAVVCVMDPSRLGLLGSLDWRWGDIDQVRTVDVQNDHLCTGMRWLAEEVSTPSFASELQVSCILTMLAIELHRYFAVGKKLESAPQGKLSSGQLALLKEYIEAKIDLHDLSLTVLATACKLPARELSALFKQTTGQTLRSYVASTHIARAKVLLDDGELLIKQVAYRSGFRSAAAFGEAFRRATGMTPLQYRQSHGVIDREGSPTH